VLFDISRLRWIGVLLFIFLAYLVALTWQATMSVKEHLPDKDAASVFLMGKVVTRFGRYGSVLIFFNGIVAVERNTLALRLTLSADRKRLLALTYAKSVLTMMVFVLSHGLVWHELQAHWQLTPVNLVTWYGLKHPPFAAELTQMFTGGLVVSTLSVCITLLVRSRPVLIAILLLFFSYVVVVGGVPFLPLSIRFPKGFSQLVAHLVPLVLHSGVAGQCPCFVGSWPMYQVVYCAVVLFTTSVKFVRSDL